jgi:hypothetical protein
MTVEIVVELSDEQVAYYEARALANVAKGKGPRTVVAVVEEDLRYARSRRETLARDTDKERKLRADGARSGVTRKRYSPRHKEVEVAAPETPEAVKEWAAEAPVNVFE